MKIFKEGDKVAVRLNDTNYLAIVVSAFTMKNNNTDYVLEVASYRGGNCNIALTNMFVNELGSDCVVAPNACNVIRRHYVLSHYYDNESVMRPIILRNASLGDKDAQFVLSKCLENEHDRAYWAYQLNH